MEKAAPYNPLNFSPTYEESPAFQGLVPEAHTEEQQPMPDPLQLLEVPGWTGGREMLASLRWNPGTECTVGEQGMHSKSKGLPKGYGTFQDRQELRPKRRWQECLCKHMVLLRTECPQLLERK